MTDLAQTQLTIADVYEVNLDNESNTTLYFTSHNKNILYDGSTYLAHTIRRTKIDYHMNLQVDKVKLSIGIVGVRSGGLSYTIPQIVKNGFLRNAHVLISRVDYVALDAIDTLFEGWVTGDIEYSAGELHLDIGSLLDKLRETFPKFIYSESCNHQLYGEYCQVNKDSLKESGPTVGIGSTRSKIVHSMFLFSAHPEKYWEKGEVRITSGDNTDISREITEHNDGNVELLIPFPNNVLGSAHFSAWPGCDKAGETCNTKFTNYQHFGGFEYIPKPEMLYYP